MSEFYTTMAYMERRFEAVGRRLGCAAASADEYADWRDRARAKLRELIGLDTMLDTGASPRVLERVEIDGSYSREKLLIDTEPGVTMPLYVLKPLDMTPGERRAAVITPHGHSSKGKLATAGVIDDPAVAETVRLHNYDYAVQVVRRGLIAFAPDARGFGERRESTAQSEEPEIALGGSCAQLNKMALPLGQTVTGMWTWDLMRLADYIQSRDDCIPDRIGCAGLSGGGLQTLWLAALDDRIRACVISGYMYGCRESLLVMSGNCSCNYVPHLWEYMEMGDIAALIAPRPLLIETGDQDSLNGAGGLANVRSQVDIARRAYRLLGAEDRLLHDVFAGEHRWNGVKALPWLSRWL
jgi:dienelactone hydrolase